MKRLMRPKDLGRNVGISRRSADLAPFLVDKAASIGDNAFTVNSISSLLYKLIDTQRTCSCLQYKGGDGTSFITDRDINVPTIILDESDPNDPVEQALESVLEAIGDPREICPVCYSTGKVGGYCLVNSHEVFVDTTYPNIQKTNIGIRKGRPAFFKPLKISASYIEATIDFPSIYTGFIFTVAVKDAGGHTTLSESLIEIKAPSDPTYTPFSSTALAILLATTTNIMVRFKVEEEVHGFFIRVTLGETQIRVNFPKISETISDGQYDYWDTQSVSTTSKELLSTRDIIQDTRYNRIWRVLSIDRNEPLETDIGKDITIRRVRSWEGLGLLP